MKVISARKSHSKEREDSRSHWKGQALISDDPGQSLRKLVSIVGVNESTMRRIAEEDLRYKSHTLKIQMLSEAQDKPSCSLRLLFWPQPRFKSLGLLRMERSWKSHKSRHPDVIKDWGSIRRTELHYNVCANASDRE